MPQPTAAPIENGGTALCRICRKQTELGRFCAESLGRRIVNRSEQEEPWKDLVSCRTYISQEIVYYRSGYHDITTQKGIFHCEIVLDAAYTLTTCKSAARRVTLPTFCHGYIAR